MKSLLTALALVVGAVMVAAPTTAEAGGEQRYHSSCGKCGHKFYSYKAFVGRDHCGRPIYRWVPRTSHNCRSSHSYRSPRYDHGYGHRDYRDYRYRSPRYNYGYGDNCRTSRSGVYFRFGF